MSSAKKDRNLQSLSGRTFPPHTKARLGANGYAQTIAEALHAEYGGTHAAVKTVVDQTGQMPVQCETGLTPKMARVASS
jgi:hypothetical protein